MSPDGPTLAEARFREMADNAPVMLWLADTTGECEFFNEQWLRFTGRGLDRECGVGWAEGIHFEDFQGAMATYLTAFAAGQDFRMEYRLRRYDGVFRWILDTGRPRVEADGTFAGFVGSCIDITEIREARLQKALTAELELRVQERTAELERRVKERDALVREIHHRVKNNLQLVSSLINMHRAGLDARGAATLENCRARINTMARVHDRLFRAKDMLTVSLRAYLGDLVRDVHGSLVAQDVALVTDIVDVGIHIDAAIPCGLIFNELITNALKHGFPDHRGGTLWITATCDDGRVRITLRDDGVGLPPGFDLARAESLGSQLVVTLVEQLGGTLDVRGGEGTTIELTFSLECGAEGS